MPLQVKSLAEWEREGITDMLSVVIPAHNEEGHIGDTVEGVTAALEKLIFGTKSS
jgi:dolichol-phosphate mannosyltransferase